MQTDLTPFEALTAAVNKLGGVSALARLCQRPQPTVWKWVKSSKRLPAEYVLCVEAATGVSRHALRPDIYPVELPHVSPVWTGVDRGTAHDYFQTSGISQRSDKIGAAA